MLACAIPACAIQQPSSERSLMTEHTLELRSGPMATAVHAFDIVSSRTLKTARPAQAVKHTDALESDMASVSFS